MMHPPLLSTLQVDTLLSPSELFPYSPPTSRGGYAYAPLPTSDTTSPAWWLKSYSHTPVSRFQPLCSELCPALSAQSNAFDGMRKRGIDLHDAFITDISGDGSPTFSVYREMQELAPPIIERILSARVMKLTVEEEESAIGAALSKKRKRACEQLDEGGM